MGACLFDHVTTDMKIYKEEIFGPVLSIVRAPDYNSAIEMVNEHEFGNSVSITRKMAIQPAILVQKFRRAQAAHRRVRNRFKPFSQGRFSHIAKRLPPRLGEHCAAIGQDQAVEAIRMADCHLQCDKSTKAVTKNNGFLSFRDLPHGLRHAIGNVHQPTFKR